MTTCTAAGDTECRFAKRSTNSPSVSAMSLLPKFDVLAKKPASRSAVAEFTGPLQVFPGDLKGFSRS